MNRELNIAFWIASLTLAVLLGFCFLFVGCSKLQASGRPEAERVFTTEAGYVCFIVRDEAGKGVGGNCVRD